MCGCVDVGINSNTKRQELDFLVIIGSIKLNFIATILCVQVLITAIGAMGDDTMLRWVGFIALVASFWHLNDSSLPFHILLYDIYLCHLIC